MAEKKVEQSSNNNSNSNSTTKNTLKIGASSLVIDEAELRKAGIRSYSVEVKCCANGNWNILYEKQAHFDNDKSEKQK